MATFKSQALSEQPPCLLLANCDNCGVELEGVWDESLTKSVVKELNESCCIGSSHGWLIFLDERASPFLVNPRIQGRIQLLPIDSFMGILEIQKSEEVEGEYSVKYRSGKFPVSYMKNLRENLTQKCVLSSDPCFSINNFGVVLIYGREAKLAYYKHGESSSWTELDGKHQPYQDIVDEDTHPLVCPYRTLAFHVYKLDFDQKKWVEVDFLGDHAVFLGGNHSISVSVSSADQSFRGYKRDSIYFTDDYWERMNEDYLYGGHDIGAFTLENQSFQRLCESSKIHPPPCWVAGSAWCRN